ncbi:hypothetical protein SAMN06295937_104811 [Sphingopyxis flava]|uniref:Uncharacterized protein n=1 Tax=Sphingopyxis flava TaxID=1507287 RepID=A0A1T5FXA1_9SPHN|nr:hypothetical protein SAMN06295937_104811 [Sphingopyxis flava]
MSPAAITCQPSHALQTLASGQRQRQLPSVVIVARRLLLATANGSQNSPTGAATYRPSKLTPTGLRNRRATAAKLVCRTRYALFVQKGAYALDQMGRSRSRVTHLVKCVRKATEIMNCSVSVEAVEGHNTLFPVRRYDQDRGRSKGEKRGQRFEERPRRTVAKRKAWSTVANEYAWEHRLNRQKRVYTGMALRAAGGEQLQVIAGLITVPGSGVGFNA